jgi:hypothetical protein
MAYDVLPMSYDLGVPEKRRERLARKVSDQLCECGCGQFTMYAARTYRDRNIRAGEPRLASVWAARRDVKEAA